MKGLAPYIARRGVQTVLTIFFIIVFNFFLINLSPGDPATLMAGEYAISDRVYVQKIRERWGLDKPIFERFLIYLNNLLHGNLGYSYRYMQSVIDLIAERIPATLLLTFTSLVIAFILGILLGMVAARRVNSHLDVGLSFTMLLLYSMPVFWLGLILILVFSIRLHIFPIAGMMSARIEYKGIWRILDILWHLILPASTLALVQMPVYFKITRASVLEQATEDYVRTFRAYGFGRVRVFRKYVLRNALLPPVTVFGLHLGYVLSGAALVEIIFGWPGMGRLLLDAAFYRDYPLLMGLYLIMAITVSLANFLTDMVYMVLDPRVKYR